MIESWTLHQFKSVFDRTTLALSPLTVFAGANSSGKSTILQSILLTTQTVQSPVLTRSTVLNGQIVKLGGFDDVISHGAETQVVSIGFTLTFPEAPVPHPQAFAYYRRRHVTAVECSFTFSASDTTGSRALGQLQPRLESSDIRAVGPSEEEGKLAEIHLEIRHSPLPVSDRLSQLQLTSVTPNEKASLEYEVLGLPTSAVGRNYRVPVGSRLVGASLLHFLPIRLAVVFDSVAQEENRMLEFFTRSDPTRYVVPDSDEELQQRFAAVCDIVIPLITPVIEGFSTPLPEHMKKRILDSVSALKASPTPVAYRHLLATMPNVLSRSLAFQIAEKAPEIQKVTRGGRAPSYEVGLFTVPPQLEAAVDQTRSFFSRFVKYLGPLRDEPKSVYPLAGAVDPRDVGFTGEYTAAVLELHKFSSVSYFPSRTFSSNESVEPTNESGEPIEVPLLDAVLDWLQYMGVAGNVETADLGKFGHQLRVAVCGDEALHDLTHVGVGVSQVLPILVLSLLAESGSTLVFEQPELHLHPLVQTRLADFFVSMIRLGKQCLVETHSEYLINRLRYRCVMDEADELSKNVSLYFVERTAGRSAYKQMRMNEFGVIANWPKGFFDETENLAADILKAGSEKRRRRKRPNA